MALAAEGFTTQSVPELVNHLHDAQRQPHIQERVIREELLVRRHLGIERVEVQRHMGQRRQHE